jgi:hypothetical protein
MLIDRSFAGVSPSFTLLGANGVPISTGTPNSLHQLQQQAVHANGGRRDFP